MELSNRELNLVESIGHLQKQKVKGLVAVAIILTIYWALRYTGVLQSVDIPFDSLLILYLVIQVGDTFTNLRAEDRYIELLRRYVNNDADTLAALAKRKKRADD